MITVDGISYHVRCEYGTLKRTFELVEGKNSGEALDGTLIRDVIGTRVSYQFTIEPEPSYRTEYDSLVAKLFYPADHHSVIMPYGQSTLSFNCKITGGTDQYDGQMNSVKYWSGLTVNFIPMTPQIPA